MKIFLISHFKLLNKIVNWKKAFISNSKSTLEMMSNTLTSFIDGIVESWKDLVEDENGRKINKTEKLISVIVFLVWHTKKVYWTCDDVNFCFVSASSFDFMLLSIIDLMWHRNETR